MICSKDKQDMKAIDCNMNLALNKHVPEKHKTIEMRSQNISIFLSSVYFRLIDNTMPSYK